MNVFDLRNIGKFVTKDISLQGVLKGAVRFPSVALVGVLLCIFGVYSFFVGVYGDVPAFRLSGWLALFASAAGVVALYVYSGKWMDQRQDRYATDIVRLGVVFSLVWAVMGLAAGVWAAMQMVYPLLNFSEYTDILTFGRMRTVHTTSIIFGFAGNVLITTSFYVVQRTSTVRLVGGVLPWFVVIGYQVFLLLACVGYMGGINQAHEYAEPEWYLDILLAIVWVGYFLVFLLTLVKRKQFHIYVANWFYLAFIVVVAILHIGHNIALPLDWLASYSHTATGGVQHALMQWWYGHNAVGFLLTAGFLGLMYYFVPKEINRPIYSYRLSILHFWSLIFLYVWLGPHHLFYTALPEWVQTLGTTFSLLLWLPSWGGAINGMLTYKGAWGQLVTNPVARFLFTSLVFYAWATFEGPLLSIRPINALGHYTDWIIGHVHVGTLGWVGMVSFGAIYYLTRELWGKYSVRLVEVHYWLALIGTLLYAFAMLGSGVTQGLMLRESGVTGALDNSFVDTLKVIWPYHYTRMVGGIFYLIGACLMFYTCFMAMVRGRALTQNGGKAEDIQRIT